MIEKFKKFRINNIKLKIYFLLFSIMMELQELKLNMLLWTTQQIWLGLFQEAKNYTQNKFKKNFNNR